MKHLQILILLSLAAIACKNKNYNQANPDGSITISGKVTVAETGKPPLGITTMNVANKWVWQDPELNAYGDNEKVYVDKQGQYSITIQPGDTLMLIPNPLIYGRKKRYLYTGFKHNQTLDIQVKEDAKSYAKLQKELPEAYENLQKHIQQSDPEQLITVSGTVISETTNRPVYRTMVSVGFVTNTKGTGTYHLTDKEGKFSIQLPKGNLLSINGLMPNSVQLYPQSDTVVQIKLPKIDENKLAKPKAKFPQAPKGIIPEFN